MNHEARLSSTRKPTGARRVSYKSLPHSRPYVSVASSSKRNPSFCGMDHQSRKGKQRGAVS